ncbi:hypothetical protein EDB81DRAFT_723144 [Dactylonectria macrodidyma]|uniref:Zn(2)-C6 fungal-type domain-containing protein n=1 Tax=Dactylonectria macrodidyma TaxID=307937 RepID=A0A9P9EQE8_9HYPO|nr:hypothetical protein EDB81DRAFT_723144 [Dactylonectria macrodidyma]
MRDCEEAERAHASSRCPGHPVQRRSHKKSRNGCRNCKRRRIKCDENKPVCKNCSRCSIPCDFNPNNSINSAASAASAANANAPRKRGRPLKKWTASLSIPETGSADSPSPLDPALSLTETPGHPQPLNVEDLQLFHHYMSNTSLTFGDNVLWRDKVPRLAFENHFLLHLMLSISALHLARLRVLEVTKYEQLAEAHSSLALREVTDILPRISRKNCSALYIATVLVCNYTFAKTPKKGHLLVVAEGTEVAWWVLFRGVRFVIETMGLPAIFSGHLGPFPPENSTEIPQSDDDKGYIPWEEPLSNLEGLIANWEELEYENLDIIRKGLVDCFNNVYGTAEKPADRTYGKTHVVMRWLWFLEDGFINLVKLKTPPALVLLAHFAVLLQTVECFWYMRGWAHHVIDGTLEHLDPDYTFWISWPKLQVGCRCNSGLGALYTKTLLLLKNRTVNEYL